ncbi:hypothetical protein FJZ36_16265 [Candidatus Poribacteria bacterium]|nr:hypothetical protein [Candidatus Poribacteria bacterium]
MKGARGWALLAGLAFVAVGFWQILVYSGAPSGHDPNNWLEYISNQSALGKTWGLRTLALLLAIAPIHAFVDRAKGGFATAARGFFAVWLPLSLVCSLIQTQPVERLRSLYGAAKEMSSTAEETIESLPTPDLTAAAPAEPSMDTSIQVATILWRGVVEPLSRVTLLLGLIAFACLAATAHRKAQGPAVVLILLSIVVTAFFWLPVTDGVVVLVEGLLLGVLALAMPHEPERFVTSRH